jgi:proteic killer suppression protein
MIQNFRHKGLQRLYERNDRSKVPPEMADRIEDILALLDVASEPSDLDRPALRLHPLKGTLRGFWAVTVRANWRIIFRIEDGNAYDVDFIDYH